MNATYILHSKKLNKFYIGATHEGIESRIQKHNNQQYGLNKFTAKADDWELFLFIPTDDYAHAIRIERKIKAMKSAKFILKLKENNDLREWLVSST